MERHKANLQFFRGDTQPFELHFSTTDKVPLDITGNVLRITIKKSVNDPDSAAVIKKRIVCPEDQNSQDGIGLIVLGSDETKLLEPGVYLYDIQHSIPGDPPLVSTAVGGMLNVIPDITQDDG
ncbi:MAG: hypothetical protein HQL75_00310 [Magnetococcales bacterium]|nr:hypothetical protein [Magnetococcales bacterium]